MALERRQIDLAIPVDIANKPAVRAKLDELDALIRLAKIYAVKINEGAANEEMTVRATWHICHHDTGDQPCEEEQEI